MIGGAALALIVLTATNPAAVPGAPPAAVDPCLLVPGCHEFGRADVTGDGVIDRIGYRVRPYDPGAGAGQRRHTVRIIVTTGDGRRLTADSRQSGYFEGPYGAAPLDGVPGAEIALSWLPGLHSSQVQVFTYRDGRLERERSWYRDSGFRYGSGVEWIPGASPASPIMRECTYEDVGSEDRTSIRTSTVDFTWQAGRWVRGVPATATYEQLERVPWQCMRFRVPGMARAPMNVDR